MRTTPFLLLLAVLLPAACDQPGGGAAPAAPPAPASLPDHVQQLGDPLTQAPRVDVEELFAKVAQYKGQRVRVEGTVKDFCHHKRAWFGVSPRSGEPMLRAFCLPRFEAPVDCKGKRVVAEGVVDVHTIPAEQAAHYAREHQFLTAAEAERAAAGQPIERPILRVSGAEFF